ncbi:MAG: glycosyl hydrolase [Gemmatimonadaceae bacterium]
MKTCAERKIQLRCLLVVVALSIGAPRLGAAQVAGPPSAVPPAWPTLTREAKPWTRWWWMGSAVDSVGLTSSLEELSAAGFGGVEVTAIYGARGAERAYVPYLSPQWVALLSHAAVEAHRRDMGLDMPQGSGWRNGGPSVTLADASASLHITVDTVEGGEHWRGSFAGRQIRAIVAFGADGRSIDIPHAARAEAVQWTAPPGTPWKVYVAEVRFSGDDVKRPAPGGEGRAIDVFSREANGRYLTAFGARIAALPRGAVRSFFHDSFEYTGNATPALFEVFQQRRGYDLAHELPALLGTGDADRVARVKSDYRQTLDEMLLENFLRLLTAAAHEHGSLMREQAHGSPGNILDLYATADIPETELIGILTAAERAQLALPESERKGLASCGKFCPSDLVFNKFASSAAHVAGRRLASAESFTWLGEHFTSTLDDVKRAADHFFLSGINHLIYHGTAYSPQGAAWPGWQFYASTEFNSRNALWRDLPTLNRYVARVQSAVQSAAPDHEVLLYWPIWDNWHDTAGMRMDFKVTGPTWLSEKPTGVVAMELWKRGYGFDFVSDRLLDQRVWASPGRLHAGGGDYAVIMVPPTEHIPPQTMVRLFSFARAGATVLFVGELPRDVPGLARLSERRRQLEGLEQQIALSAQDGAGVRRAVVGRGRVMAGASPEALLFAAGVARESLVDRTGLRFIRQRIPGSEGRQYFINYMGDTTLDAWIPLATPARVVEIMDPMNGHVGLAALRLDAQGVPEVRLQLEPGQSLLLRTFDGSNGGAAWEYRRSLGPAVPLRGRWSVTFLDGGPLIPAPFRSDSPVPWTARGDEDADRFAGTARYVLHFDAQVTARNFLLDLGRVGESARVRLNGRDLGTLISRPFRVETGPLRAMDNVLEIDVTNLSGNRVRDLDRRQVTWKIFTDINFVGLDYKPFDASTWPVRTSGLAGPVMITPLATRSPR